MCLFNNLFNVTSTTCNSGRQGGGCAPCSPCENLCGQSRMNEQSDSFGCRRNNSCYRSSCACNYGCCNVCGKAIINGELYTVCSPCYAPIDPYYARQYGLCPRRNRCGCHCGCAEEYASARSSCGCDTYSYRFSCGCQN